VHHGGHLGGEVVCRRRIQAQPRLLDVSGHGGQPGVRRKPLGRGDIVLGAHECVDPPSVLLEEAAEDFSSYEPGGAREKHGAHIEG